MNQVFTSLHIEHFRAFRQLDIQGLGRVNLITGRNNTGKTSVLEALRILASDASPSVIAGILRYREEDFGDSEETVRTIDTDGAFLLSGLFNGFPRFSGEIAPIGISARGSSRPMELTMEAGWFSQEHDEDGEPRPASLKHMSQLNLFEEGDAIPAFVIRTLGKRRTLSLDHMRRFAYRANRFQVRQNSNDSRNLPCVFVSPYGGGDTATLGALWDGIALTGREQDVIEALHIIDPRIRSVTMVGGENPRQQRTAIVKADNHPRPVPLRSYGDGLNRLFGIILSLVNAKGGLLLIDEFENGLHHTVQSDAWRSVFKISRHLGVQVFATSHGWDSIEAFQEAAAESPEDGALIRLTRKGEEILPTVFSEEELAIATRDRIELR